jgi:AcrR family transcriptional regulator
VTAGTGRSEVSLAKRPPDEYHRVMDKSLETAAARRRTGRRPGKSRSREDILEAARRLFADKGFDATSVRAISREAGVDPALVHHFFGSKEEVFNAALADVVKPEEIFAEVLAGDQHAVGERLVHKFLAIWEHEASRGALLAILRSAVSHPHSAELLGRFMAGSVLRHIAESVDPEDAEIRGSLVSSQLIGLALLRYVLRTEPLASASIEQIEAMIGPTINRYLLEPGVAAGAEPGEDWVVRSKAVT